MVIVLVLRCRLKAAFEFAQHLLPTRAAPETTLMDMRPSCSQPQFVVVKNLALREVGAGTEPEADEYEVLATHSWECHSQHLTMDLEALGALVSFFRTRLRLSRLSIGGNFAESHFEGRRAYDCRLNCAGRHMSTN